MPRNVLGCDQGVSCGYCPYGCRLGAKQSTVKTWLADADAAGSRILVGTRRARPRRAWRSARRAGPHRRRTRGHCSLQSSRCRVRVDHDPALLRHRDRQRRSRPAPSSTSGLGHTRHLRGGGSPVGRDDAGDLLDEHRDLDGGYGLKYETTAAHPTFIATLTPWQGAASHAELMDQARYSVGIGALLRDWGEGRVRADRDGRPIIDYHLGGRRPAPSDRHRRHGSHPRGGRSAPNRARARATFDYEPGRWTVEKYMRAVDEAGFDTGRLSVFSFHQMGTACMGGSADDSACDPDGRLWDLQNGSSATPRRSRRFQGSSDGDDRGDRPYERVSPRRTAVLNGGRSFLDRPRFARAE